MVVGNENDIDIKTSKHSSWFSIAEDLILLQLVE